MQMQVIDSIFYVAVLIMSVVAHEYAHGYVAYKRGDNTANSLGRLTLNPLKHLDPVGSVIVPLFLVLSGAGFVIGWAKPVPYDPRNLKGKKDEARVAIAGVVVNLCIALFFGLILRFLPILNPEFILSAEQGGGLFKILIIIVITNINLAVFNLIPIPPLDGSKVLFSFLPHSLRYVQNFLEQYGFFVLIFFIFFLWKYVAPVVSIIFSLITGM